ncbi:molecular chaperone [Alteromonas sp. 5E99-2]|uniref:molecular chaperone n=1 Tax=Alteromonas sp. 5E99-2 TaxID=2817683 RepID=UPI001A991BC1|nr:molecular chaperone [Alteromonas sp. 5E99-2]MBO1254107.1 molecular chaperone [Alteromonas sp. 5E99-2]
MYAGLDFGTSNCSIGTMVENEPTLIPIDGGRTRLSSCLFIEREVIKPFDVARSDLMSRVSTLDSAQNTETLISIARKQMQAEHRNKAISFKQAASIVDALKSNGDVIFGEEAELTHIDDPESGFYVKSPKSFLGADINKDQQVVFTRIVEKMLAHIKQEAESVKNEELNDVVIGRPVNFHGLLGNDGNEQALAIIGEAAQTVGFKHVEFLMEPVAAAYDYERQLTTDKMVLILDLGGGTTDCSVIKLGPSYSHLEDRQNCILSHTGRRIGGIDLDNKLALMQFMPHFGKDAVFKTGLPVPSTLFRQAVSVNDVGAQRDFNLVRTGREIEDYCLRSNDTRLRRLQQLRDGKFGLRVSRSAEQAKIDLSDNTLVDIPMDYIESGFDISVSRDALAESIADELSKFEMLMHEAIQQAGVQPDVLYVTGGTAMSPVVQQWINGVFPGMPIVVGDHFGSVTSGLVTQAARLFK